MKKFFLILYTMLISHTVTCKAAENNALSLLSPDSPKKLELSTFPEEMIIEEQDQQSRSIRNLPQITRQGELVYLGESLKIPHSLKLVNAAEYTKDHEERLRKELAEEMKRLNIKNIKGVDLPYKNQSAFFYAENDYRISFMVTSNLLYYQLFPWPFVIKPEHSKEQQIVESFINNLKKTMYTKSEELSNVRKIMNYVNPKFSNIHLREVLSSFIGIYEANKFLFEKVADDLKDLNKSREASQADYNNVYLQLIKGATIQEEDNKKIYPGGIFDLVLKDDLKRKETANAKLEAYIEIYHSILNWVDFRNSFRLTCQLGADGNELYANAFCDLFIFKLIDLLIANNEDRYYSMHSFCKTKYMKDANGNYILNSSGKKVIAQRFHIIKFKKHDSYEFSLETENQTIDQDCIGMPGIVLCGQKYDYDPYPKPIEDRETVEVKKEKRKDRGCSVM